MRNLKLLPVLLSLLFPLTIRAQENNEGTASSLQAAQEISEATGRPIFAIAGRST